MPILEARNWVTGAPPRLFAGVAIGRRSGRLKTALVRARGDGWGLRIHSIEARTSPPPTGPIAAWTRTVRGAILELVDLCHESIGNIELIGIGNWASEQSLGAVAALLAEIMGVTVVSGFGNRDQACGGRGEPLSPAPDWFLFHSPRIDRLVVELGASLRVSHLGAAQPVSQVLCFDVGPCCAFLDGLALELSQGRLPFDPSGHYAVQGRQREELINKWLSHPYLLKAPPKFVDGEFGADFRAAALAWAREQRYTARDILCSANHFVVRNLVEAIDRFLRSPPSACEFWISGGGGRSGFLWKLLQEAFPAASIGRVEEAGIPSDARPAVHAALLAYLTMENLAGNIPELSGARRACVLGHITPGSTANWERCVVRLADRFEDIPAQAA